MWCGIDFGKTKTKLQAQHHNNQRYITTHIHTIFSAAETLIESIACIACVLVCCIINYATSADVSVCSCHVLLEVPSTGCVKYLHIHM